MNALILVKPSEDYIEEIRAYRQEFFDFSSYFNGDSGLRKFEDINAWIEQCRLMENKETLPNPDRVEAEQFMLVDKSEKRILGMINFRHYLNAYLAEYAGHIGYAIRPSERRRGYATAMLKLCLQKCRMFGIDKVLLTCNEDNEGSRRTILLCGGVFDRKTIKDDEVQERYWITLGQTMKPIAYCGLACCVCAQNDSCVGCQNGECDVHGWCKNYNCCREKGLDGCWECSDFPCSGTMLDKPRIRAFARFAKEYGTDELARCLLRNKENGIVYHYDGQHIGDYDKCETEEEIIEMIKTGVKNEHI